MLVVTEGGGLLKLTTGNINILQKGDDKQLNFLCTSQEETPLFKGFTRIANDRTIDEEFTNLFHVWTGIRLKNVHLVYRSIHDACFLVSFHEDPQVFYIFYPSALKTEECHLSSVILFYLEQKNIISETLFDSLQEYSQVLQ